MSILERTENHPKENPVEPPEPLKSIMSWYAQAGKENNALPCGMCCYRHEEPSIYPDLMPAFTVVFGAPAEETEESKICGECRAAMRAAEQEYTRKLCGILHDDGRPASEAEMLLMLEAHEERMAEHERIGAEHEARIAALRTA